jgi:peptidoglycan/LPS O-acetylase OafA/YrhL
MQAKKTAESNPSAAPLPKSPYRSEIDGLRAFAVVAVIINHFNKDLLPSGYLGVDIFFVISGYVITSSLANHRSESFGDFFLGFYARRLKRLVPALVSFVSIAFVVSSLFIPPEPALNFNSYLRTGVFSLFGFSNLYLLKQSTNYFASSTEYNVYTHTWSLGVEEQFYLVFPFLIWLSGFGRITAKGGRNLFWTTLILSIGSLIGFIYFYPSHRSAAYFLMPPRIWELGAGCLVFLALRHRNRLTDHLKKVSPSVVAGALMASLLMPLSHAVLATITVVSLTVCLLACLRPETFGYRLFTHPQIIYLGLISYSLYLWHWGVLCISRWTIGIHWWSWPFQVALMLLLAIGSYRYVETPLRRQKASYKDEHIIGLGLSASLGSALLLLGLGNFGKGDLFLGGHKTDNMRFEELPIHLDREAPTGRIIVLGNSYAHHLLPLISRISEAHNLSYSIVSTTSKPIPSVKGAWLPLGDPREHQSERRNPSLG